MTWDDGPPAAGPPPDGPPAAGPPPDGLAAAGPPPDGPPAGDDDAAEEAPGPPGDARVQADVPPVGPHPGNAVADLVDPPFALFERLYAERASRQAEAMQLMINTTKEALTYRGTPARNQGFVV